MYGENLVTVLQDRDKTGATATDDLEARAYLSLFRGSLDFEKSRWNACIENFAISQVVYTALAANAKTDIYKDLLSSIVEPSIRYAAYQVKIPRTKLMNEIVAEKFPEAQHTVRSEVLKLDPRAFQLGSDVAENQQSLQGLPSTISWRRRTVTLEDASISQALGVAAEREQALEATFEAFEKDSMGAKDLAAAYDDVITARQDAADATKTAIDELVAEGVDPADSRMQSLQITRTAVNYAVIEWRVGRNRILCGPQDGLVFEPEQSKPPSKLGKDGKPRTAKVENSGQQLARLRERVALYDAILQSLDAVKDLPGVIADTAFVEELDGKRAYFRALKCLAVGRSHAINEQIPSALALYARALDLAQNALEKLGQSSDSTSTDSPPKLNPSVPQLKQTVASLSRLVTQYRAFAELKFISHDSPNATSSPQLYQPPLVEQLHRNEYHDNVDLKNIVNYPPTLRPVPVKPIFFDLAWNYIQYPGQAKAANGAAVERVVEEQQQPEQQKGKSRGWFGFGR